MIERLHNSMAANPVRWTLGLIVAVWLVLPTVAYWAHHEPKRNPAAEAAAMRKAGIPVRDEVWHHHPVVEPVKEHPDYIPQYISRSRRFDYRSEHP